MANQAMTSLLELQQGAFVFSAHHNQEIFVDGDIFSLPADNVEANRWCSANASCSLFCRCCKVPLSSLSLLTS